MDPDGPLNPMVGRQCKAVSSRSGERCRKSAMAGLEVCGTHGGRAPQAKAAGLRRVQAAKANEAVVTFGLPRDIDPHDALIDEIARTNGHVRWLAGVVADLDPDALAFGPTQHTESAGESVTTTYILDTASAAVSVWVQLYQSERAHLVAVCKTAIACGIAERQVRVAEQTGEIIAQVLRATVADPELGLPPDKQKAALRVVSRHLRVVTAA